MKVADTSDRVLDVLRSIMHGSNAVDLSNAGLSAAQLLAVLLFARPSETLYSLR